MMNPKQRQQILNLSSDLRRIAWWAADIKNDRSYLIERFLRLVKPEKRKIDNLLIEKIINDRIFNDWNRVKTENKAKLIWAEELLTASLRLNHLASS